ncbi:MAG: hypothetical protein HYZ75_13015 [Elusimicrobia bacterium]|nr:hypothetical protein [Elusimicrobiota bacterium]
MLLANALPLLHALAAAAVFAFGGVLGGLAVLYVLPPLASRLLWVVFGRPAGRYGVADRSFSVWWVTLQLQTLFLRLPFLEELLRLVPGLYSAWLRLWGSRLGARTYWSPGTVVLDRGYLDLGDDVALGAGVRLNGHVLQRGADGRLELVVDVIRVGDRAALGGYSLFTAGSTVAAGESLRACLISPPYSRWEGGRRVKSASDEGVRTALLP